MAHMDTVPFIEQRVPPLFTVPIPIPRFVRSLGQRCTGCMLVRPAGFLPIPVPLSPTGLCGSCERLRRIQFYMARLDMEEQAGQLAERLLNCAEHFLEDTVQNLPDLVRWEIELANPVLHHGPVPKPPPPQIAEVDNAQRAMHGEAQAAPVAKTPPQRGQRMVDLHAGPPRVVGELDSPWNAPGGWGSAMQAGPQPAPPPVKPLSAAPTPGDEWVTPLTGSAEEASPPPAPHTKGERPRSKPAPPPPPLSPVGAVGAAPEAERRDQPATAAYQPRPQPAPPTSNWWEEAAAAAEPLPALPQGLHLALFFPPPEETCPDPQALPEPLFPAGAEMVHPVPQAPSEPLWPIEVEMAPGPFVHQ